MTGFSIIGAGRLGVSLGRALAEKGLALRFISDIDPRRAREGRRTIGGGRATSDNSKAASEGRYVFVSVPDDSIEGVTRGLARNGGSWRGRYAFHTSGILPSRLLSPLKEMGALVASLHPAQSFPEKTGPTQLFKGITWGIEGDEEALLAAEGLIRKLGGNVLRLGEADKAVYHTACSLASNSLAALVETAVGLLEETGIGKEQAADILLPLAQGTLQNVKNLGPERALTGPVTRGDLETVRAHLEVLESHPAIAGIYRDLALKALGKGAGAGLPPSKVKALKRLLEGG